MAISLSETAPPVPAGSSAIARVGPAARRWAIIVSAIVQLDGDIRTIDDWAREIGMGRGAIKCRCANAGTTAKDSLDFARLLRAVSQPNDSRWFPRDVLDVVDPRTLRRLCDRGGIDLSTTFAPTPEEFLQNQTLITAEPLIAALRAQLDS
jgi:hypothetical protein